MQDKPYFMEKEEWFYFDGEKFVLTDKAPEKAKESLEEFYRVERKEVKNELRTQED